MRAPWGDLGPTLPNSSPRRNPGSMLGTYRGLLWILRWSSQGLPNGGYATKVPGLDIEVPLKNYLARLLHCIPRYNRVYRSRGAETQSQYLMVIRKLSDTTRRGQSRSNWKC